MHKVLLAAALATTLAGLRVQLAEVHQAETEIHAQADREERELTAEEAETLDLLAQKFDQIDAAIKRKESLEARSARLNAPAARVTTPADPSPQNGAAPARITGGDRPGVTAGAWGWQSFGEYSRAVKAAALSPAQMDGRLLNAASTYGNEATAADGGFAVPPDFRAEIMKKVGGEESLLARTDQQTTSSNKITVPTDETTPWQSSGGVQAYWEDEAATLTASKLQLGAMEVKANKLTALVPMTDEILEDAPALGRYLPGKVAEKFTSKINDVIVNGNGVGKAKGLLASASKIAVAKESSQTAATIVYANILKMWSRMLAALRSDAVWLVNQDIEPQLFGMTAPGGTVPAYLPPNGLAGSPFATLMGRPVIPVEACETIGTEGDIILTSLKTYLTVQKAGGMRAETSIHLYFDQGLTAFRFIMRIGGQSWWSSAVSPAKGSNTRSNIVTLATRA